MTAQTATDVDLMAQLMRSAGFGAPAWELERLAERGYEQVVDELLSPERVAAPDLDLLDRFNPDLSLILVVWARTRPFFAMVNSQRQLQEKMALFWHGLFATSLAKTTHMVLMSAQYDMLRAAALDNFETILERISREPAMLHWLDQQTNHGSAVNENYGRELLELFSLGVGNYSEDDVRAASRAFTGWRFEQVLSQGPWGWFPTQFDVYENDHDHGAKTFLGVTGDLGGDDIIHIIVQQPAAARFIAKRLYTFFVDDEPNDEHIELLAQAYLDSGHEIREVLRTLFLSDFFKAARFKRVMSPVEYVVSTVRLTGEAADPEDVRSLVKLSDAASNMGQRLMYPPSVEGWHPGREWLDSSSLTYRVNFAAERLANPHAPGIRRMIGRIAAGRSTIAPAALLDACLYELGALELQPRTRRILIEELGLPDSIPCEVAGAPSEQLESAACDVFRLIAAAPEHQFS